MISDVEPRLRVLHVTPYFPPDRVGGVGEVVAHLHRGLLQAGHDSLVLTAGDSTEDTRVRRIAATRMGFVLGGLRHLDLLDGCDVIHCHHGDAFVFLQASRWKQPQVPLLATFHVGSRQMGLSYRPYRIAGYRFGANWENWRYRFCQSPLHRVLDAWIRRTADELSFISRSAARDVLGDRKAESATIVYNALTPVPANTDDPAAEPIELLYVGPVHFRKRTHLLPFILAAVRSKRPGTRLRIVGFRLEDEPRLLGLFRELGVADGVISEGRMRSDEIRRFYRAADILLMPSAYEGLPMVILEAFQCGLPCVATRVSGHPEVIEDGVNGFLVDCDAPEEMASRCVEILQRSELRTSMAVAARETAESGFGQERQLAEYLEIYRRLAQR